MQGIVLEVGKEPALVDIADDGDGSAYFGLHKYFPEGFDSIRVALDVLAYVGDMSLLDGSPYNPVADALVDSCYQEAGASWLQPVCGPVVILGLTRHGDSVPVPAYFIEKHFPHLPHEIRDNETKAVIDTGTHCTKADQDVLSRTFQEWRDRTGGAR